MVEVVELADDALLGRICKRLRKTAVSVLGGYLLAEFTQLTLFPRWSCPIWITAWEQRKFSDMYVVNNERNANCELGYDRTLSIATMTFNGGNGAADDSLSNYKVIRIGDIAFEGHTNKVHAYGRFVLNDAGDGLMSPRFSCLRPIVKQRYSFWKYYIPREESMRPILVNATKSGTMMNELVPDDLMRESILVPCLAEQEVIGNSLSQLDHLITLHQRKCQYRGLYGYLSWEQRKLNECLTVSSEKNSNGAFKRNDVLSVSKDFGVINQIAFQGRSFAGADLSNYGVLNHGEIVYTKSPLKDNPFGIIKSNKSRSGIVSTLYTIYRPLDGTLANFIDCYFSQDARVNNYLHPLISKGAKNDMKVSAENALKGTISIPSVAEQKMICELLAQLDSLITLHQ